MWVEMAFRTWLTLQSTGKYRRPKRPSSLTLTFFLAALAAVSKLRFLVPVCFGNRDFELFTDLSKKRLLVTMAKERQKKGVSPPGIEPGTLR